MALSPGDRIGRYDIIAKLGEGGMGEVYRARDASLGRDLAIKILPPELTRDPTRVERFVQEARAASALNHPHLTSIYEIGSEPVHYIAMELVQGRNLGDVLAAGRLDLKRTIDCLLQVCDALGAAHQAGVVHRDIKPANLMITDDGYAKVLDFGVAKLKSDAPSAADEATRAALTGAGAMVGTSGYMSPEQARGQATDHRTDIFSLGCVLYECVTGARAFDAPSAVERMHRVINDEPHPIPDRAPGVPSDLVRVVRKCLAKNPDERYQTMKDLAVDLRDVRRQLDTSSSGDKPSGVSRDRGDTPSGVSIRGGDKPSAFARRRSLGGGWSGLSIRQRGPVVRAVAALAVVIGGVVLYQSQTTAPSPVASVGAPRITLERMTTTGNTIDSSISPDGTYLAHVEAIGNQQSLWIREVATGQERELVPSGSFAFFGVRFSPDGREIFFTTRGQGHGRGRLNVMSRDGGDQRIVLTGIMTPVTFSPGAKQVAFYREQYPDQESSALMLADADGKSERVLATRRVPEAFSPGYFTGAAWSPDGRTIVGSVRNLRTATAQLLAFDAASGQPSELLAMPDDITFTLWLPDGSGIVFVTRAFGGIGSTNGQLWLRPYPEGEARRITSDLIDYRQASLTADGSRLTTVGAEYQGELYTVPLDGAAPRRVRSQRFDGFRGAQQLRDGSVISGGLVNGESQVIRLSPDATSRTVLTSGRMHTLPVVSPDESLIVMVSVQDRTFGLWSMRIDGTGERKLADIAAPDWLSFTPDGRHVICTSYASAVPSTWRVPVDGGQAVEIARQLDRAVVSPDGRWLAGIYSASVNTEALVPVAAVIPLDGHVPLRQLPPLVAATGTGVFTWARDGSGLIASTNERFNLFFYPISGEPARPLTKLQDDIFVRGSLSPDGKHIIASRGKLLRDTLTIRGFR